MNLQKPTVGIVVPCYNESEILQQTDTKLGGLLHDLISQKRVAENSFIVYVDDGSADSTWEIISKLADSCPTRKGIKFSRNFGHQSALLGGVSSMYQEVDCIITIDADLQDDIRVIEDMITKFGQGFEIVYGVRKSRDTDSAFKKTTAQGFYKMMRTMGVEIVYNHADFRLASSRVCENLLKFGEVNLFLRGIFPLIGFNSTTVYYDRLDRTAGETKYPLMKMLGFALEGITSFSVKPLRIVSLIGISLFFVSLILALYSLYSYIFLGTVPGWTSITLPIYFIGGVQILCIGIIGEYLGKIYKEVKSRPRYIIETIISKKTAAN